MIAICGRFCSSEGVINSSCGNYGSFLTWRKPFPDFFLGGWDLWAVSKVEFPSRARASSSDVSILDVVYDCHLTMNITN